VFVLVRPRAGDFVYTDLEHRTALEQIHAAKALDVRGIVTGALTKEGTVDETRVRELFAASRPLAVTFHRAFDDCIDQAAALESLIRLGVDRVLTSGGAPTAPQGGAQIRRLVLQAGGRTLILAGGGITGDNVAQLVRETGVRELHLSAHDADKIRRVVRALAQLTGS